ncbi:MAG: hypothetical protein ACI88H_004159 [Cocleimonas sp.]|jgi:hypothetical protein
MKLTYFYNLPKLKYLTEYGVEYLVEYLIKGLVKDLVRNSEGELHVS